MPNKRSSRTSLPPSPKLLNPKDVLQAGGAVELVVRRNGGGAIEITPILSTIALDRIATAVARVTTQMSA